jgi:branched-chain amino acid transport system substrate-binding protein
MQRRKDPRTPGLLTALVGVLFLLLTACAGDEGGDGGTGDSGPIVVGGTLGLTGQYSGPSAAYKATYEFWADQVNQQGGLLGRKVELRIYDDESNPTTAQQLFQRLINQDQASLLLAPYTTAVGGAVVPLTERAGKILWDAGFVSAKLHDESKLLVTSWPYQEPEYPKPLFELFKTLPADQKPKTLAVVTAQNPFTLVARDGYKGQGGVLNYAKEQGIRVVYNEEYDMRATDLSGLIQGAKAARPDAFIALSLPNDAALIARTVSQLAFAPRFYCSCGSQVTTLPNWKDLGAASNNVFSTTTAWPTQDNPGLQDLFTHLQEQFGYTQLPAYAAGGLAILQVMEQAVKGANTLDQQKLREYVGSNTFKTAVGDFKYKPDGTLEFGALLVQYQGDKNEVVWPDDVKTGDARIPFKSGQ